MIHFEHTAAAFSLWLGAAHRAYPEPFADFHREVGTLGPMARALVGHVMSRQEESDRPSWSPDDPYSLYLAFERYQQVLYGKQTPSVALSLCPYTLAAEAAALHDFAERYACRHPRLGWKLGVARLAAWHFHGFIPASEVVRSVEHGAPRLSEPTRRFMLEAGFFGQRFEHFFDGTIPHSTDGRVSVLHAIYHAMSIPMGAFSCLDMFDDATVTEIQLVAHDLASLMARNPVLLAALRAQMGDDKFSNWLNLDAFAVFPYTGNDKSWASWVTRIPELPIRPGV